MEEVIYKPRPRQSKAQSAENKYMISVEDVTQVSQVYFQFSDVHTFTLICRKCWTTSLKLVEKNNIPLRELHAINAVKKPLIKKLPVEILNVLDFVDFFVVFALKLGMWSIVLTLSCKYQLTCFLSKIISYGEDCAEALLDPDWLCPPCRGRCNCSICRTREGKRPTGVLYPIAASSGYQSVDHFLVGLKGKGDKVEDDGFKKEAALNKSPKVTNLIIYFALNLLKKNL